MTKINLRSKQHNKSETNKEPSLRERAMRALDADFKLHGEDAIKQMRETKVDRYVELATRPAEAATDEYADCNSQQDLSRKVARKLLQDVGFASPDDISIQAAMEARDLLIATLEAIRDAAEGRMQ